MRWFKRKRYRIIVNENNQYGETFTIKCTYDEACMVAKTISTYLQEDGTVAVVRAIK